MAGGGQRTHDTVREGRVRRDLYPRRRSRSRAACRPVLPTGSEEPGSITEQSDRCRVAGPFVPLAAIVDRPRDGIPPLTAGDEAGRAGTIDLHVHSTASDGSLAPEAVVKRALTAGLRAIALTDHDTLAGIPEATSAGERV